MSSSQSSSKRQRSTNSSSVTSKSRKSTTPYDCGFEQNLINHDVYLNNRAQTLKNWEKIKKRLAISRSSLLFFKFFEAAFKAFWASDFQVKNEDDVMIDVVSVISDIHQNNHFSARKTKFENLNPLTDDTIASANLNLFYDAHSEQLDWRIHDKLSSCIILLTMKDKSMTSNFYFKAKGSDEFTAVTRRQACYNDAVEVRGLQSLQSYEQDGPIYNNNAYTITSIYHNGQLQMYTTHITLSAGLKRRSEYQMTQFRSFAMTDTIETFQQGVTAFWNGQDLVKEWRKEFISAANERVDAEPPALESLNFSRLSDTTNTHLDEESETSVNESAFTTFLHSVEKPKTVYTLFLNLNEDDILTDKLNHTSCVKLIASFKHSDIESKKTVFKNPHYSAGTCSWRRQFKK